MTARITQPGGTRYFSYLPTGQVSSDQRNPSSDYIFNFNNSGRLASANLNQGGLGVYTYNGLEQRAIKAAATTTDFLYDQAGHMIAEANHLTGVMIREYIWRDDTPVALVVYSPNGSTSTVYDIHADHLNRPQKITTQNASLVWDGAYDPFGIPAGITGSVTMPLMFPGQYWDSETQLSQNWNRDYDPTIGRYIESDPIGLWGGANTYTYVIGSPLNQVDMRGTGPLGGYIGGFLGAALGGFGGEALDPLGGGVVGGWEGFDEGYSVGSGLENIILMMRSRGNTDPYTLPVVDPGKDCNDDCNPVPA